MGRPKRRPRLSLYTLHRWIGVLAALFVLHLAITGLVLNHASDWGLDRRPVRLESLQRAYGIEIAAPQQAYAIGAHWLSGAGGRVYWDDRPLGPNGELVGVAASADWVLAVGTEAALLIDRHGTLIERSDLGRWPGPILAVGAADGGFVITTPSGGFWSGPELLDWTPFTATTARALAAQPLPAPLAARVQAEARSRVLDWQRVLLDLHSGRLPGPVGVLVTDLLALTLIGLALSGVMMWLRHRRRQRPPPRRS